ncbi:hypothetical protein ACWGQL_01545 [Streptomyces lydicus]
MVLERWRASRQERELRRRIAHEEARDPAERMAEIYLAEQQGWERFRADSDKAGLLTRLGLAAFDLMPSRWPDGSDLAEESLDIVTGVTMSAKHAVGHFAEGKLSEAEIRNVVVTAIRILSRLGTWNQPLCYDALPGSWTDETIAMLRTRGFEKEAARFQRGRDLEVKLHETAGHTLIR